MERGDGMGKWRGAAMSLLCALGMALAGTAGAQEKVVRVAMTVADVPEWTGAPDQGFEGRRFVGYTLYDALVLWDLSNPNVAANITPGLATSWQIDPANHKRWIFKLREGVTYHDGCPWNADSLVWNFARFMDKSAPQFNQRHSTLTAIYLVNVESVQKIDNYTVAISTKAPNSLLPYELAFPLMISNCAVQAAGNDYTKFAQKPAGTGPYKFGSVTPRQRLELVPNPGYWNRARIPKHDRLVLMPMPEASTRAAALLAGQVDFVEAPPPDAIPRLKSSGMQIVTRPYPHNWTYMLRQDVPPFNDIRVRKALNHAVNSEEVAAMLQGLGMPAYQTMISTQPWYSKDAVRYEHDPKKAEALLKEAGCYPCAFKVAISTSGSGQMQPLPMNELVKEQLEKVGFKVELAPMDWNALTAVYRAGGWKGDYNAINISMAPIDPVQGIIKKWMSSYISPIGSNWGKINIPEIDALGTKAMAEFDNAKRDALLKQINEIAIRNATEMYVVHDVNPRALSPKLKGYVQAQSWFQDMTPIVVVDP